MKDLYQKLGVDKNASREELKKQYRKKSMKSHPDHGGDPEEFKALVKAYKILENPETRKRYDDGEDPDKMEAGATQQDEVTLLVISLYSDVIEQCDPIRTDVIKVMLDHLQANQRALDSKINDAKRRIVKYENAQKRTKRKEGHNLLADMMANRIGAVNVEIAEFDRQKALRMKAKDWLEGYSYEADKQTAGGFSISVDMAGWGK